MSSISANPSQLEVPAEAPPPYSEASGDCPPYTASERPDAKVKAPIRNSVFVWPNAHVKAPTLCPVSEVQGQVAQDFMVEYIQVLEACEEGDLQMVQTLLYSGVSPNAPSGLQLKENKEAPYTPLEAATRKNHIEIVRVLLIIGAHIHLDFRALARLLLTGEPDRLTVKLLADSGLRINTTSHSSSDTNLVHYAITHQMPVKAIESLIQNDGYHKYEVGMNQSPLHAAIAWGDPELVRIMLDEFQADSDAGCDTRSTHIYTFGPPPLQDALSLELGHKSRANLDITKLLFKANTSFDKVYGGNWDYLDMKYFRRSNCELDDGTVRSLFETLVARSGRARPPSPIRSLAYNLKDRTGLKGDPYLFLCFGAILGDADIVKEVLPLCEEEDPKKRYTKMHALAKALQFKHTEIVELLKPYAS